MAFCSNCGEKLNGGAKFCHACGASTNGIPTQQRREQEFAGRIIKCPNCGEVLESFSACCPACGIELRGTKATSSVREFAHKLEAIEAQREHEKLTGIFGRVSQMQRISKTDEQKISLIKNFSVPNTKEDILEFMILATSNVDMSMYSSLDTPTAVQRRWSRHGTQRSSKYMQKRRIHINLIRIFPKYRNCMIPVMQI